MDYKGLLNNIYIQFKSNKQYIPNQYIKFFKDNNTNIVNFEINDINLGMIKGTIVEQSNSVLIYFYIKNEIDDCVVLSKANIIEQNMATITNVLLKKGYFEKIEKIKRHFNCREELYKVSSYDEFININELDSEFINLILIVINNYNARIYKKKN